MMILLILLLFSLLLYVLAVMGRKGHPGLKALRGWAYAHRGLHGEGIPENSMAAFRAALDAGFAASLQDAAAANGGSQAGTDDGGLPRRRDTRRTASGSGTSVLNGSILSPDTWRQSAAFIRRGRTG